MPFHALRPGDCRGFTLVSHADELLIRRVTTRAKRYSDAAIGTSNNANSVEDYQMPVSAQRLVRHRLGQGVWLILWGEIRGAAVGRSL